MGLKLDWQVMLGPQKVKLSSSNARKLLGRHQRSEKYTMLSEILCSTRRKTHLNKVSIMSQNLSSFRS
jgi:hypothetical protein